MAEKRYFPIRTETSCQLKWTWSTIWLNTGLTSSCHRVAPDLVDVNNFNNFHNTPKKLSDRQLMLDGQWPKGGCEYCKNIEDAGGTSDRLFQLTIPDQYPPELDTDLKALSVTPRIVEISFDNVCNQSCLYCYDGFSSQIQHENNKHGRFEKYGIVIENRAKHVDNLELITEKFWDWLRNNVGTLRRLHVMGGEPLYQHQFETCLQILEESQNPDLEFNVISNLNVSESKFQSTVERIKKLVASRKIKRFDLTASIDCFGPEQEYVRHGLDLELFKNNFEYVASQRWVYLNFNQTITSLTIKTMPELLEYVQQLRTKYNRDIHQHFSRVVHRPELLPNYFGSDFYKQDFERILELMPEETNQQRTTKSYMIGIKKEIEGYNRDDTRIEQLSVYLDEIDRRRNLNWKKTFPWLAQEVKNVVQ